MPKRLPSILALAVLALAVSARAGDGRLAPIPNREAVSTHSPYEMGACETCHQRHDAKDPGPALKLSNDLCFDCHDEFKGGTPVKMEKTVHPSVKVPCTMCHNPHNARKKRLRM